MNGIFVMTKIASDQGVARFKSFLNQISKGPLVREFSGRPDKGKLSSTDGSITIEYFNHFPGATIEIEDWKFGQKFHITVFDENAEATISAILENSTFNAFRRKSIDEVWDKTGEEFFPDEE